MFDNRPLSMNGLIKNSVSDVIGSEEIEFHGEFRIYMIGTQCGSILL